MSNSSLPLQSWRFIPSKYGSYPLNRRHSRRSASRRTCSGTRLHSTSKRIDKPVDCLTDTPVNQRIRPCQLGVALRNRPESFELLDRIFPLVRGEAELEIHAACQ